MMAARCYQNHFIQLSIWNIEGIMFSFLFFLFLGVTQFYHHFALFFILSLPLLLMQIDSHKSIVYLSPSSPRRISLYLLHED